MKTLKAASLFLIALSLFAQSAFCLEKNDSAATRKPPKLVLIGSIQFGPEIWDVSPAKVEAALNLAALLTKKYALIPLSYRDSVAEAIKARGEKAAVLAVADSSRADLIVFVKISRFVNMLRSDLVLVRTKAPQKKSFGVGYSPLRYRKQTKEPLYDPSLLESLQRAFAAALKDSNLYANLEGKFKVFPAKTLAIAGLAFEENEEENERPWNLFEAKTVSSYYAVESVFDAAKDSPRYAVYDTETRDSIYASSNLYVVENYNPISLSEIRALYRFAVDRIINGVFRKIDDNKAQIKLFLSDVERDRLKVVGETEGILKKDNKEEFGKLLRALTKKLLKTAAK